MTFFEFFQKFLGVKRNEPSTSRFGNYDSHQENFRNPIWQSDEDDDDDDIVNFWHPENSRSFQFNIDSNPLEMMSYFESQIDNMLNNFFNFNNTFFGDKAITTLPFATTEKNDNLRNRMLKTEPDTFVIADVPIEDKVDTDLDGRGTVEFSKMWNKENMEITKPFVPNNFSFSGRSVRKEIIRRADGAIEKKQIIRDSEGNEETIISKEANNKTYVVTVKKDKNGVETRSEDIFNMDESELNNFNEKWKSTKDNIDGHNSTFHHFSWEKFFGPNPKL
ncbi:PREDICTED: uncharacterized protein LOC108774226 [Cyphomyrmex costatus]|uniref:HCLS1-associated protein X-1 n=1 Tax=Cyphomyrmex costatus TaxID=456900 RepID=A0A151III1_9HYME|nr:PREDICTED: uncharacterized protein LOC108774226 [Cyphomyrmex costatus]KYN02461.1 hypothetical protein ALC62_06692 [Cyphomyrmex costatus]